MVLEDIKGIGLKRISALKEYGIYDIRDLVSLFPSDYRDTDVIKRADEADDGEYALLKGRVLSAPITKYVHKGFSFSTIEFQCTISGSRFSALYYNRPYIKNQFISGADYLVFGKVQSRKTICVLNPITERFDRVKNLKGILTLYPQVPGVPQNVLRGAIVAALDVVNIRTVIPRSECEDRGLKDLPDSYRMLHCPKNMSDVYAGVRRVAIEEMTKLIFAYRKVRQNSSFVRKDEYFDNAAELDRVIAGLSFNLTESQHSALSDIMNDLKADKYMNRLIMGDVGSGKTIVAFLAMYYAAMCGRQALILAPTEVLARQHYERFIQFFPDIQPIFLTSSLKADAKRKAVKDIADGAKIVIGTHSLFSKTIEFKDLALVVTDEQQRFGVAQRNAMEQKSKGADVLIMSATPIPRTMSLLLYGDLDVSLIERHNNAGSNIDTVFVPYLKVEDMFDYIAKRSRSGVQSYIVCPKIDEGETDTFSAKELYSELIKGAFRNISCALLHGKMKESEKNRIMSDFNSGRISVLISTTVVEVGIDVKAADIIAIMSAERYGLSQLHQLRGRVGRSGGKAYCFLITNTKNADSLERLNMLRNCADGFKLSEYDFETRGAGDFIGTRQHGFSPLMSFKIQKTYVDAAKEIADKLDDSILEILDPRYIDLISGVTLN